MIGAENIDRIIALPSVDRHPRSPIDDRIISVGTDDLNVRTRIFKNVVDERSPVDVERFIEGVVEGYRSVVERYDHVGAVDHG